MRCCRALSFASSTFENESRAGCGSAIETSHTSRRRLEYGESLALQSGCEERPDRLIVVCDDDEGPPVRPGVGRRRLRRLQVDPAGAGRLQARRDDGWTDAGGRGSSSEWSCDRRVRRQPEGEVSPLDGASFGRRARDRPDREGATRSARLGRSSPLARAAEARCRSSPGSYPPARADMPSTGSAAR